MVFVTPQYSKKKVNRAGDVLTAPASFSTQERAWANTVLSNWRACHGYPMNTFQATLRAKLRGRYGEYIVAQRLKRAPSIIAKLQRFDGMRLARMQDIGGLRAVVGSIPQLKRLERDYRETNFEHVLTNSKDYIAEPKEDGYRSIHLMYRYSNDRAPEYNGLSIELQFRTVLQHAWATAVETMGTFLGQALKSGRGEGHWRVFFAQASAALALIEKTPAVSGYEGKGQNEVFATLAKTERKLQVLQKLQGFAIAANQITKIRGLGAYHLIVLDSANRTVTITPYSKASLVEASIAYAEIEQRTASGETVEAVLVAAGPVSDLRKAYPNYFLDTQVFIKEMRRVIRAAK